MLVAEALLLPRHSRGFIWLLPTKKHCRSSAFFVAEMGECHSCTQHPILLKTTILYLKKSYMSMVYHQSSYGSIQTTVNNSTINCLPYSNTKWNCNISDNSQMLNNTLVNLMKKWFSGRRNITGP